MVGFHITDHAFTCLVGIDVEGIEELAHVMKRQKLLRILVNSLRYRTQVGTFKSIR